MSKSTYNELMNRAYTDTYPDMYSESPSDTILRPKYNRNANNVSPYAEHKLFDAGIDISSLPHDDVDTVYLDRLRQWDSDRYAKASKAIGETNLYRACGKSVTDIEKFLSTYYDKPCKLLSAGENLGYAGYHYTYLTFQTIQ